MFFFLIQGKFRHHKQSDILSWRPWFGASCRSQHNTQAGVKGTAGRGSEEVGTLVQHTMGGRQRHVARTRGANADLVLLFAAPTLTSTLINPTWCQLVPLGAGLKRNQKCFSLGLTLTFTVKRKLPIDCNSTDHSHFQLHANCHYTNWRQQMFRKLPPWHFLLMAVVHKNANVNSCPWRWVKFAQRSHPIKLWVRVSLPHPLILTNLLHGQSSAGFQH